MRAVVQRVSRASVSVDGQVLARISRGLLVLLGVAEGDGDEDARYLAAKVAELRVFPDEEGKMNRSVEEAGGEALVISQFTLLGDVRKGRRPSYAGAAAPPEANRLYEMFAAELRGRGLRTGAGSFGALMDVELVNEGPVTILLDSRKLF